MERVQKTSQIDTEINTQTDDNCSNVTSPPPSTIYFGLDPLTHVFQQLFIKDVQDLERTVNNEGNSHESLLFHRNDRLVSKVDIIGLVTMVDSRRGKWSCVIDDGTGVIVCNKWATAAKAHSPFNFLHMNSLSGLLPDSLKMKQNQVINSLEFELENLNVKDHRPDPCCAIGDIVRVRGRVVFYAGHKEIEIISLKKCDSPTHEINRILELPKLYSEFYDKPVCLPRNVKLGSDDSNTHNDLKCAIQSFIENGTAPIDVFKSSDVTQWPCVKKLLNAEPELSRNIQSVFDHLINTGFICEMRDDTGIKNYEIVKSDCRLVSIVLRIIQEASSSKHTVDKGCHYLHIVDRLRHFSDYVAIGDCVVERILTLLECDSEIICVGPKRYLAVN